MAEFAYQDLLPLGEDATPYRRLTSDGVAPVPRQADVPRGRASGPHPAGPRGDA